MQRENIFKYQPFLQIMAENMLASRIPGYFEAQNMMHRGGITDFFPVLQEAFTPEAIKRFEEAAKESIHPAVVLYYFLMGLRKFDSRRIPPHDINMLMANLVHAQYEPFMVDVDATSVLPAALLLASRGWEIIDLPLPPSYERQLRTMLPEIRINSIRERSNERFMLLSERWRVFESLRRGRDYMLKAEVSFFLDTWDFLGVRSNEHFRRYWLKENPLTGILQLPRLKRQAWSFYSTILHCRKEASDTIRMASMETCATGEAMLDQSRALSLMLDEADNISSIDVSKSELEQDPSCNFTPSIWLRRRNTPEIEGLRLGDCAQIIRCQLPREKIKESLPLEYGQQADGSCIAREAGMAAIQDDSGFLLPASGDQVRINFKNPENRYKYLLQENDIIFSFRGTQESLGKVGFVSRKPEMFSITGPAFCIVRVINTGKLNPIWLYWFLQTEEVRSNILTRSSGTRMLNIGTDDIKDLIIRLPDMREMDRILDLHETLSEEFDKIFESMLKMRTQTLKLKKALQK